jgi:hypothetical protein
VWAILLFTAALLLTWAWLSALSVRCLLTTVQT